MNLSNLAEKFYDIYGYKGKKFFFSPSRINLIGEHIDYNGGYVLPCAIELGTYGCVQKRDDNLIRLASGNFDLRVETDINDLRYEAKHGWGNYPKGVIHFMKESGYGVSGMDILVWGNIPNGAGLSSSASLELLIAEMINNLFNDGQISKLELVKHCQKAENDFIGVKCGIMDQFAVAMGKANKAILLDCNSLDSKYISMNLKDYKLIIMNTNKRRELNSSKYNERRSECEEALDILKKYKDINNLCQITVEEYEKIEKYIDKKEIANRAHHVIYENQRVGEACKFLEGGHVSKLGQVFVESHNSLRDLYEVTGIELDTLVESALEHGECIGARMTGAGFGGCAIALVKNTAVDDFMNKVGDKYKRKVGKEADFYLTDIGDGIREIDAII